ncbi:SUKH-3 immunity protein [Streptomyces sp. 2231.1]|uniref:SUKH-3 domain-containing protein n=1 Tax=Streptomyces sp. 2231.1 TaxID=1855347 RepID=UPI00089A22F5|nr:SUKH-3 domain-containing protein [Streptomyces sp. 2231.1]SED40241.1 SUKH-3 immunity protein [Streptomyces sp. 2231.1]
MTQHLRAAERIGWTAGRNVEQDAMRAALRIATRAEGYDMPLSLFPAAKAFLSEFYGLDHRPVEPGREVASTGFSMDPEKTGFQLVQLSRHSDGLRTELFPVGVTEHDSVLAVGEEGQLLSFGLGGTWHAGDSGLEGVENMICGLAPRRLRETEHAWSVKSTAAVGPVVGAVQAALTAVYVLHHHGIYSARSVCLTLTSLRGSGVEICRRSIGIAKSSLDEALSPIVREGEEVLAANAGGAGCEVKLTADVPGVHAETPAGLVRFSARFGHVAMQPHELEVSLRVGAGAQTGSVHRRVTDALRGLRQMS